MKQIIFYNVHWIFGEMQVVKIRQFIYRNFNGFIENPCCKKGIEQPLSPNYIKQIFNKLRVVLKEQLYLKLLKENPVDTIGKIKTQRPQVEFWTVDEFKKVYNSVYHGDFYEEFYKRLMRFILLQV